MSLILYWLSSELMVRQQERYRTQGRQVVDKLNLLVSFCEDSVANGLANKLSFTYVGVVWNTSVACSTVVT